MGEGLGDGDKYFWEGQWDGLLPTPFQTWPVEIDSPRHEEAQPDQLVR